MLDRALDVKEKRLSTRKYSVDAKLCSSTIWAFEMKFFWLLSPIVCEVLGTTCLKLASARGPYAVLHWIGVVVFYVASLALLSEAMRHFSLNTVYATWSGLGVAALAVIGVVVFNDQVNVLKVVSLALVIIGVVGLNWNGVTR